MKANDNHCGELFTFTFVSNSNTQRAVRPERGLLDRRNPFELYEDTALWLMNMLEGNLRRKGMIHCL